jgi:hypothetical protein
LSSAETDTPPGTERQPEVLSLEEIADYEELRTLVSRKASLAVVDDFAKWLFAIAALVGTLGASFGVSGANSQEQASGCSQWRSPLSASAWLLQR